MPVVAPGGTLAEMLVALQPVTVAVVPLNLTLLVPCEAPKLLPLIVTATPTAPVPGDTPLIAGRAGGGGFSTATTRPAIRTYSLDGGGAPTVNGKGLLGSEFTCTTTLPLEAPAGTAATMELALQEIAVAWTPLKATVLAPWGDPKSVPAIVTDVPTGAADGVMEAILGGVVEPTVKFCGELAVTPFTITETGPVAAPAGTCATIQVALQDDTAALVPLNRTLLVPWVAPKLEPAIVTEVPTAPEVGDRAVMTGGGKTKNSKPLLEIPDTVTTTFPLLAPFGAMAEMLVALQLVTAAGVPLKVTLFVPCVAPKLVPVMVTVVPMGPDAGETLVIVGPAITVKNTPLLATPATVTITLPLPAPPGTAVVMLVALQLLTVALMPLNFTVLVACAPPKLLPLTITVAPG